MNIDYAVISSDDSHYLDYYNTVSQAWNLLGVKTAMFHITNETSISENDLGIYVKIKAVESLSTVFQSQVVRIYAHKFLKDSVTITSDIDMMPLNFNYFNNALEHLKKDKNSIINLSGQPYGDTIPYFAMCYILSESNSMINLFDLNVSFEDFLDRIINSVGVKWNSDEHYMYNILKDYPKLKNFKERVYTEDRIDRSWWGYDANSLNDDKYKDAHLPNPYKANKFEIDTLLGHLAEKYNPKKLS
jgi:hypothetical protein